MYSILIERRDWDLFLSWTISRKSLNDREECWRKRWWRGKFIGIGKYFAGSSTLRLFLLSSKATSLSFLNFSASTILLQLSSNSPRLNESTRESDSLYFIAIINARAAVREENWTSDTTLVTLAMKDARPTRPGRGPSGISYVPSNVGSVTGSFARSFIVKVAVSHHLSFVVHETRKGGRIF